MPAAIRRGSLALALGLLLAPTGHAPAGEPAAPTADAAPRPLNPSDELLLEVLVDQHRVADAIVAWQSGDDVLLPLEELAGLLTLAIDTEPDRGIASGYILDQQRTFSLDLARARVTVDGVSESFDPAQARVLQGDIYISSALLSRWLPVDLELDMSRLSLRVRPRELLPLQHRIEREAVGAKAGAGERTDGRRYPRYEIPYRVVSAPFIDQTLGLDFRGGNGRQDVSTRYTAYATGDLLGMEGALYVNAGSGREGADVRMTLGRNDPDARLLGPLRARTALVGSVPVPAVANISRTSVVGEGVVVSNRPLSQPDSFGQHSLQGPLPPGWDVELYFNDSLVGFQASTADGRYRFDDMQLLFGANEFRLVFHGPLGEVRVERETFLLEQSLTRPGEFLYSVAGQRDEDGHARMLAQFDWGLAEQLGATGGFVRVPVQRVDRSYANLGLRGHWRSVIVSGEAVRSDDGGSMVEATLRTRLGDWSVTTSHANLDDFSSELFPDGGDPIRASTQLRVDGRTPGWSTLRMPVAIRASHERRESGGTTLDIAGRTYLNLRGTAISGQLRWQSSGDQELADATLQASRRLGGFGLRGQVNYSVTPETHLQAVALTADKRFGQGYLHSIGVTRFFDSSETLYSAALNRSLGRVGFGINTSYSSTGEITTGVQLFVAMGRDPRGSGWRYDALPRANTGAVSALAFLDDNMNGRMDAGEQPIEGMAFQVNGGTHPVTTNAQGVAYLERLPVMQHTEIEVSTATLEDPQWQPKLPGVSLVPRPGTVAQLAFPVIMTSEVEGMVYLADAAGRRGIGALALEVIDAAGAVVATATSAADGYFVLTGVPAGDCRLRAAPTQLQRLGLEMDAQAVQVSRDDWLVSGIELDLRHD